MVIGVGKLYKRFAVIAAGTISLCAKPNVAAAILQNAANKIIGQAFAFCKMGICLAIVAVGPIAIRTQPKVAGLILKYTGDGLLCLKPFTGLNATEKRLRIRFCCRRQARLTQAFRLAPFAKPIAGCSKK
jgi:hypothetical protein